MTGSRTTGSTATAAETPGGSGAHAPAAADVELPANVPPDEVELEELDHPPRPSNLMLLVSIGAAAIAALGVLLLIGRSQWGEPDEVPLVEAAVAAIGSPAEIDESSAPPGAAPDEVGSTPGAGTTEAAATSDAAADTADADPSDTADADPSDTADADPSDTADDGDAAPVATPNAAYVEISGSDVILRGPVPDAETATWLRIQLGAIVGVDDVVDATTIDRSADAPAGPTQVIIRDGLDFGPGDTEITSTTGRRAVAALGELIEARPDAAVTVAGHTDAEGSAEYNVGVARQRVTSLLRLLVFQDVWIGDIERRYVGEAEPIANNITEAGRASNRRIEITIDGLFAPPR